MYIYIYIHIIYIYIYIYIYIGAGGPRARGVPPLEPSKQAQGKRISYYVLL